MINLGDKVKDKVSGLKGIAVAKLEYLQGCLRFSVQPQECKDGKPVEASWFDEPQLVVVGKKVIKQKKKKEESGGPAYLRDTGRATPPVGR